MTSNQKNKLVTFFCITSINDIVKEKQTILDLMGVSHPEELNTLEDYDRFFKIIQDVAVKIDKITTKSSQENQVKANLNLLYQANEEENSEMLDAALKILEARVVNQWNPVNQGRYKEGVKLVLEWVHFSFPIQTPAAPQ